MVHFCFVFTDLHTPEAYVDAQAFYNDLGTLAHQNWYEYSLRSLTDNVIVILSIYCFQCHRFTSYH